MLDFEEVTDAEFYALVEYLINTHKSEKEEYPDIQFTTRAEIIYRDLYNDLESVLKNMRALFELHEANEVFVKTDEV